MFPQVFIFGKAISNYALVALIGGLTAGAVFCRLIRKRGLNDNDAIAFLLIVSLGVMLGGHLLFGLTQWQYFPELFRQTNMIDRLYTLNAIFGGSVFYGGLFGGIAAGLAAIKIIHLPKTVYADCIAPIIPLFHGIARIGCFLAGCCYGVESKIGFTATGNPFVPAVNGVSRFPVQLLEAICNLLLAIFLLLLLRRSAQCNSLRSELIWIYFAVYSSVRFADEFLRGDNIRGFIGFLSTSQWISILLFIVVLIRTTVKQYQRHHMAN